MTGFALTSRVYPSLEDSIGVSYGFGEFGESKVRCECWESLKDAWPARGAIESSFEELHPFPKVENEKPGMDATHIAGETISSTWVISDANFFTYFTSSTK